MGSIVNTKIEMIIFISTLSIGILLVLIFGYLALFPIIGIIIFNILPLNNKYTLIWIVIVTLLTLVGEINPYLRVIVQVVDICILVYLFLKDFGLEVSLYPKIPDSLLTLIIVYYFTLIFSTLISNQPLQGIILIGRQSIFFLIVYLLFALIKDVNDIKVYIYCLLFAAFIMSLSTIYTFLFVNGSMFNSLIGDRERITGLISNPNNISNYYMIVYPILLISLSKKVIIIPKYLNVIILLVISVALFFTLSRSAILGIVVSSSLLIYYIKRRLFIILNSFVVLIGSIILLNGELYNLLSTLFRLERGTTGRDYLWQLSFDIIKDNFFFGLGPGQYKYEMYNYFPVAMNSWVGGQFIKMAEITKGANLSHNYFLYLFSEIGIVGLFISIGLPIIFFLIVFKSITQSIKNSKANLLFYTIFTIGVSVFIRGLFESIGILNYGVITTDLPFWLIFIILIYMSQNQKPFAPNQQL